MKDAEQKAQLYQHFRARGWYAMIEVPVFPREATSSRVKLITDVDVLGLRPGADLRWEILIGDCKTRRGESPANRALWARALMEHFDASRGYVILRRARSAIEPDHKLMAHKLGVTLLDEAEFASYDRALTYTRGATRSRESAEELLSLRASIRDRFGRLTPLCLYIEGKAWSESEQISITRRVIANLIAVRTEIDPAKPEHIAVFLEAAGVASVGIASVVGDVFHQYVKPDDRESLDAALKAIIWGGYERYESVLSIRRELQSAKGGALHDQSDWALPKWDGFVQLIRSLLESPLLAFRLPQLFRSAALDVAGNRRFAGGISNPVQLQLGLLTATYLAQASAFPSEFVTRLRELFVPRITEITSSSGRRSHGHAIRSEGDSGGDANASSGIGREH